MNLQNQDKEKNILEPSGTILLSLENFEALAYLAVGLGRTCPKIGHNGPNQYILIIQRMKRSQHKFDIVPNNRDSMAIDFKQCLLSLEQFQSFN